jgi:hypothetical protein
MKKLTSYYTRKLGMCIIHIIALLYQLYEPLWQMHMCCRCWREWTIKRAHPQADTYLNDFIHLE